mmetsp:Transcript_55796/g.136660  ORF Transcript_55796/g.136660 Transcript_55796/m.136660 type:complete len:202 (-) Transcript_55796:188-793(-)
MHSRMPREARHTRPHTPHARPHAQMYSRRPIERCRRGAILSDFCFRCRPWTCFFTSSPGTPLYSALYALFHSSSRSSAHWARFFSSNVCFRCVPVGTSLSTLVMPLHSIVSTRRGSPSAWHIAKSYVLVMRVWSCVSSGPCAMSMLDTFPIFIARSTPFPWGTVKSAMCVEVPWKAGGCRVACMVSPYSFSTQLPTRTPEE